MNKYFDVGSVVIIIITFFLFLIALFAKGFTHDLLLEAGVLLVSIKLIMMAYKSSVVGKKINQDLQEIKKMIKESRGPEDGIPEPQKIRRSESERTSGR